MTDNLTYNRTTQGPKVVRTPLKGAYRQPLSPTVATDRRGSAAYNLGALKARRGDIGSYAKGTSPARPRAVEQDPQDRDRQSVRPVINPEELA